MAYPSDNGDIEQIRHRGKVSLPGGGHDLNGVQKQKVLVWGQMRMYFVTTGIKLDERGGPNAIGLDAIDFITFEPQQTGTVGTPTYEVDEGLHDLGYDVANGKIFVVIDGANAITNADYVIANYLAVGDDATAPELT
ncbi:MAG: hypothetical protein JRC86_12745 [Deltaproteobacteria bacterium]|nr:hypothetical protein [Deltaproteobacteria bacterium]